MTPFIPINVVAFSPPCPFVSQFGHMVSCSPAKISFNPREYFKDCILLTPFLKNLSGNEQSLYRINPKRICRIGKTDATNLPGMIDDFSEGVSI